MEAQQRGSVAEVAMEAGASRNTVKRGLHELETGECYWPGERLRQTGGGRKKAVEQDATLQADLESLLDPKGDPMSLVRWTTKSPSTVGQGIGSSGAPNQEIRLGRIAGAFWASPYVPIKRTPKGSLILIEMLNFITSKGNARRLNSSATRSFLSIARKKS